MATFKQMLVVSLVTAYICSAQIDDDLTKSVNADDECAEGEACALNALQLRGAQVEQAESDVDSGDDASRRCTSWVTCHGTMWGGHRCSGGRYCRVWAYLQEDGSVLEKETLPVESLAQANEDAREDQVAEANSDVDAGEDDSRRCVSWVHCHGTMWGGHRCSGGRYCNRWAYLQEDGSWLEKKALPVESLAQSGEDARGDQVVEANSEVDAGQDDSRRCVSWVHCHGTYWGGHRCSGGRYCNRWAYLQEDGSWLEEETVPVESDEDRAGLLEVDGKDGRAKWYGHGYGYGRRGYGGTTVVHRHYGGGYGYGRRGTTVVHHSHYGGFYR